MLLKELVISKNYPEYEEVRKIEFKKGLNLIVDDTTDLSKDSGNNVGKTTVVKIIDLCLGARSPRTLYYDSDTRTENKVIKDFINKNKVEAQLDIIDEKSNKEYSIKRQLYQNGKRIIDGEIYKENEFGQLLKEIIFGSTNDFPTLRELMPKFVRLENSNDNIIKFLGNYSKHHEYDTIYQFLFDLVDRDLISEKNILNSQKDDYDKKIKMLEDDENISSMNILTQKIKIIDEDLKKLEEQRRNLDYIETYKEELNNKRNITIKINDCEEKIQELEFDLNLLNKSINKLKEDKLKVDTSKIKEIYDEANAKIENLEKNFEDVVKFHNQMIENRIAFLLKQYEIKEKLKEDMLAVRNKLLENKKSITIDLLDEGLLSDLNVLNNKIEELTLDKGQILKSIQILEENEKERTQIEEKISNINKKLLSESIEDKIAIFNKYFTQYSEQVYDEKYFFSYNTNWEKQSSFPVTLSNFNGNVGTGMKKGMITVFDLAYLAYSNEMNIKCPKFIIHDKIETTHINQLKTIFDICINIEGQYIVPVLRERINEIDSNKIDNSIILELSQKDKLFKI